MTDLHYIQMYILKELLLHPNSRFSNLNKTNLPNDHFNYHLKKLISYKYVNKINNIYKLTSSGKLYANTMDTDRLITEEQAKLSALIIAIKNDKLLIQKRLKEPYFGFYGFISGKIRFGETIYEGAARELKEETGLSGNLEFKYILHEHIISKNQKLLEDKFFYVFKAVNLEGKLINIDAGKNQFISKEKFYKLKNAFYDVKDILTYLTNPKIHFIEKKYFIEEF